MAESAFPDVFVTALIKNGGARLAAAFLAVLCGIWIGQAADTQSEPHRSILLWVSTISQTVGALALIVLIIFPQHPIKPKIGKSKPVPQLQKAKI